MLLTGNVFTYLPTDSEVIETIAHILQYTDPCQISAYVNVRVDTINN